MKIKPVLGFNNYVPKDGNYSIYIKVNIGEKRKLVPVGVKIKKGQWDPKIGRVKPDHPNAQEINFKIIDLLGSLEKNNLSGPSFEVGDRESFYWWFDEYIKVCEAKHSVYHTKKVRTAKRKVEEFNPMITAGQLNSQLIASFENWILNQGYHKNYLADLLTRIKYVVKMMIKAGVIPFHKNPFNDHRIRFVKTEKERLSFEEIEKLQKARLNDPQQELARDMFIVQFYGGGIRFGDTCRLNKSNFHGNRLKYQMHKTSIKKDLELSPIAINIMKKYDYSFPIGIDWKNEDQSIDSKNGTLNEHLKAACRAAEVREITFHTSRHSIADYAIKKKVSPKALQSILGHGRLATTEVYLKSFYQPETDAAMDQLFGSSSTGKVKPNKKGNKK